MDRTTGLVLTLTLAGIFRAIALIAFYGEVITLLLLVGYAAALLVLAYYSLARAKMKELMSFARTRMPWPL